MLATLSESVTRNPFDERFTGVLFGFMVALPQFFYNRAFYLSYREALGQGATQLILDEDTAAQIESSSVDPLKGRVAAEGDNQERRASYRRLSLRLRTSAEQGH